MGSPATLAPPPPVVAYDGRDEYNRADSSDLGPDWIDLTSGWGTANNMATTSQAAEAQHVNSASSNNLYGEFDYVTGTIDLRLRFGSQTSFVQIGISRGAGWYTAIQRDGGWQTTQYIAFPNGAPEGKRVRFELNGQVVSIFEDSVQVGTITVTEAAIASPGNGVTKRTTGGEVSIDNFEFGPL